MKGSVEKNRVERWKEEFGREQGIQEEIVSRSQFLYPVLRTLNRIRVGVPKWKMNMTRWRLFPGNEDVRCDCDVIQDSSNFLVCSMLEQPCGTEKLFLENDKAIAAANYWKVTVWTGHEKYGNFNLVQKHMKLIKVSKIKKIWRSMLYTNEDHGYISSSTHTVGITFEKVSVRLSSWQSLILGACVLLL